jgi:hypothetical protein
MIPQKIATGCRTRYFRHAKELPYAPKQFVSRIQVAAKFSGIVEGQALVTQVLSSGPPGPFALQAAIAAVHANAPEPASTDWAGIVGLYGALARVQPSAVVELNRAVAVAMRDGPQQCPSSESPRCAGSRSVVRPAPGQSVGLQPTLSTGAAAGATALSAAIAASDLRRWPTEVTPMLIRSSAVSSGSTSPSTSLSRNAGAYCSSPNPTAIGRSALLAEERVHLGSSKRSVDVAEGAVLAHLLGRVQQSGGFAAGGLSDGNPEPPPLYSGFSLTPR